MGESMMQAVWDGRRGGARDLIMGWPARWGSCSGGAASHVCHRGGEKKMEMEIWGTTEAGAQRSVPMMERVGHIGYRSGEVGGGGAR